MSFPQRLALVFASVVLAGPAALSQAAGGREGDGAASLLRDMRRGGLMLVYRSTANELEQPDAGSVLTEQGKQQAAGVGKMLQDLGVPGGDTYTSKTRATVEMARLASFGRITMLDALTDPTPAVPASTAEDRAEVFRALLRERPATGANIVMVADKADHRKGGGCEARGDGGWRDGRRAAHSPT